VKAVLGVEHLLLLETTPIPYYLENGDKDIRYLRRNEMKALLLDLIVQDIAHAKAFADVQQYRYTRI
jgi:hypothetical protein